jgi:hypothetical protein
VNPTEEQQAIIDRLDTEERTALDGWRRAFAGQSPTVREAFADFAKAGEQIKMVARGAAVRVAALREDDMSNPEGIRRQIVELQRQTADQIKHLRKWQDASLAVLESTLRVHSLPPVPSEREMLARDELLLIVNSSPDPVTALMELAQRGGELGAVAASSYGESLLRAKGVLRAPVMHEHICTVARAANTKHPDPAVATAAQALFKMSELEKARAAGRYVVDATLTEAGVTEPGR